MTKSNEECGIREVWNSNLEEEFRKIRQIIKQYNYVAMDTEFPGVVARPIGEFKSSTDYQYHLLRCNVDLLRLIQVGLTFLNEKGETPKDVSTWQINFKFSLGEDMFAQDSIELLQTSGLQFKRHEEDGIDVLTFAEFLMTSGLVLMENVKWLSFHSGYDFGYLLKLLTNTTLPTEETEFFELLQIYFPVIYDVKYLMKSCKNLKGGLQEVADMLQIERVGPQHQAGSDSLLTGITFFKMRDVFFEGYIDDKKYCGHLYGLGAPYATSNQLNFIYEERTATLPVSGGARFDNSGIVSEPRVMNPSASFIEQSVVSSTSSATGGDNSVSSSSAKDRPLLPSRSGSASVSSSSVSSRIEQSGTAGQAGTTSGGDTSTTLNTAVESVNAGGTSTKDEDARSNRSTSSSGSSGRTSSAPSAPTASQESSGSDSSSETSSIAGGNGHPVLDESGASIDT